MHRRLSAGTIAFALVALLAVPMAPSAEAQSRVLIPDMQPQEGAADRFGDRVARHLRDLMDADPRFQAWDRNEIRDILRDYDLSMEAMWDDCITPIQLANQIDAQVVFCGSYEEVNGENRFRARVVAVPGGEEFEIAEHQVARRDEEGAARYLYDEFEAFARAQEQATYCAQDFRSGNWEEALRRCTQAVEASPEATTSLYHRGRTHMELENYQDALDDFERILEFQPDHEGALESGGWVAGRLDETDKAREYYGRYLDLNPGNVNVRMQVAFDLAREGDDPYGAMELIRDGLEMEPDNVDLWQQFGAFAFRAATDMRREFEASADGDNDVLPAEVRELYEEAIDAFNRVLDARGEDVAASDVRNTVAAYLELDRPEDAVAQAERGLETHSDDIRLWNSYATALSRAGDLDGALDAMARVDEMDPDRAEVQNVSIRQGRWLMDAGRVDEAMEYLDRAVELGEQPSNQIANMLFGEGYTNGFQHDDFEYAIRMFEAAKEYAEDSGLRSQIDFFHGFSVYSQAERMQQPQTLETAQQTLPLFREARELFQAGSEYAEQADGVNLGGIMEAVNQFIEIQERIIERETRRQR